MTHWEGFALSSTPLSRGTWYLLKSMRAFLVQPSCWSPALGCWEALSWGIHVCASPCEWPTENWPSRCYCFGKPAFWHRSLFCISEDARPWSCLVTGAFTWPGLYFFLFAFFLIAMSSPGAPENTQKNSCRWNFIIISVICQLNLPNANDVKCKMKLKLA